MMVLVLYLLSIYCDFKQPRKILGRENQLGLCGFSPLTANSWMQGQFPELLACAVAQHPELRRTLHLHGCAHQKFLILLSLSLLFVS
jgi:hypothetical protein